MNHFIVYQNRQDHYGIHIYADYWEQCDDCTAVQFYKDDNIIVYLPNNSWETIDVYNKEN